MRFPATWLVIVLAMMCAATSCSTAEAPKPNVLFIAVDDMNDWIGCLGGYPGEVHTPNLDRLAARGVLFTNAHCTAPACNPSRASLLTGVRPSTSGVYMNADNWRASPALKDAVTLPAYFRSQGYRTTGGGKIFHALSWINHGYGQDRNDVTAWDDYYPSLDRQMPDTRFPEGVQKIPKDSFWSYKWPRIAKGKGLKSEFRPPYFMDWAPFPPSEEKFADEKVIDWAVAELAKQHDRPFFQAVGIFRPHIPWYVPREYFDLYPLDDVHLPAERPDWRNNLPESGQEMGQLRRRWHQWIAANDEWKKAVQGYLASISFTDAQLGRLLDALDASPHAGNTIIVLWSDHGFHLGERETWEKFTLWEESTRVPLMVVAPGVTTAGAKCSRPVSLLDIYPTLVDLAGLPPVAEQLEGTSLTPWLRDVSFPKEAPAITTYEGDNHAVRTERWRYIRYQDGSEELYDHESDPGEFTNLAGRPDYEDVKKRLAVWIPKDVAPPVSAAGKYQGDSK